MVQTNEVYSDVGCTQLKTLSFDYLTYTTPEGNLDEIKALNFTVHEGWVVAYDQYTLNIINNALGNTTLLGMPFQVYNNTATMSGSFKINSSSNQFSVSYQHSDLTDPDIYDRVSQATELTETLGFYSTCSDALDPSSDLSIRVMTDGKHLVVDSPRFTSHDSTCTGPELDNLSISQSSVIGTDGPILAGQLRVDATHLGTYLSWASNPPSDQDMTNMCGAPLGYSIAANTGYDFSGICGQTNRGSLTYGALKPSSSGLSISIGDGGPETGATPELRTHTTNIDLQKASWIP